MPELTPRAHLVLAKMAEVAHDSDDPPLYWGGWELLALTLGYEGLTEAGHRAVTRVVRELRDAKKISVHTLPNDGVRARYALHLEPW